MRNNVRENGKKYQEESNFIKRGVDRFGRIGQKNRHYRGKGAIFRESITTDGDHDRTGMVHSRKLSRDTRGRWNPVDQMAGEFQISQFMGEPAEAGSLPLSSTRDDQEVQTKNPGIRLLPTDTREGHQEETADRSVRTICKGGAVMNATLDATLKRKKRAVERKRRFQMAIKLEDLSEQYCKNCEIALAMRQMTKDKNCVSWCRSKCKYGKEMTAMGKDLAPTEMGLSPGRHSNDTQDEDVLLEKYQYWQAHHKRWTQKQIAGFMGISYKTLNGYRKSWREQGLIEE